MIRKTYYWELIDNLSGDSVFRYCHNCGKKVLFTDSGKRRRNANGKDIYEYMIYKCEKDHTWNLPVSTQLSMKNEKRGKENIRIANEYSYENLKLMELKNEEVKEIEVILEEVTGRWRIDKLLGERIQDLSRSKICELISHQFVLVDGKPVKQDFLLKSRQIITMLIEHL